MTSTNAKDAIGMALVYLSDLDGDYASEHNQCGFNSRDTQFGNSLAKQYQQRGTLTPAQLRAGLKMLQTYRSTQLSHLTLPTFSALETELLAAAPGIPAAPGAPRTIPFGSITADQIGGEISIHTAGNTRQVYLTFDSYHADLVNRAKDIPTRRYKDGVNIFDLAMLDKVIAAFPTYRQHESVAKELQRRAHAAAAVAASEAAERAAAEKRMATLLANIGDLAQPLPGGKTLRQHQQEGVLWGLRANSGIIADEMGLGKAQPLTAKLLTPTGWKRMGDIRIGDAVIGASGWACNVTGVFPQGSKPIYRVHFSDGASTECCDEHLWNVRTACQRHRGSGFKTVRLADIMHRLQDAAGNNRYFIPVVDAVAFDSQPVAIDPYLMGVILGDGSISASSHVSITSIDEELVESCRAVLPHTLQMKQKTDSISYQISRRHSSFPNTVLNALREYRLQGCDSETKFIPDTYLFNDTDARIALLQGLMDTDGTIAQDGTTQYTTVSPRLAADITALVQSLGGIARQTSKVPTYTHNGERRTGKQAYTITMSLPSTVQPFRLRRKLLRWRPRVKYQPTRAIVRVEYIGEAAAQCIAVDAPDRLYVTDDYIVTHNTLEALVIAKAHRIPVFVIAPKSLKDNWLREAAEAGVPVAVHSWAKIPQVPLCDFVLIADEAHYAGNIAAKRTQAFLQLARAARAVLCLTGTPVRNGRPREIFPLLKAIGHPLAADQKAFEKRYCAAQKTRFTQWDTTGAAFMAELYEKIAPWLLRRRKEDCLDLPAKSRILRPADVSAAGEKAYNDLFEQKRAEYEARLETKYQRRIELVRRCTELIDLMKTAVDMDAMAAMDEEYSAAQTEIRKIDNAQNAEALVMLSILRQAGAAAKAECAISTAREIIEQGDQVVLFCESRDVAHQIGAALGAEVLDGEAKDRQGMVDRFQRGERKAIVCTFKAGGVGITLTAGSYNILVDRPWTPGDAEQAEDRIYRIGQTKPTTMLWLQYGDVDDKIDTLLVSKARQSEAILSGDPAAGAPVSIASMALSVLHDVFSTSDAKAKKGKAA